MGSDRARISFDRTREYRSLIAQQGRVTLEADVNEQAFLASEALRLETIDLVGPAATPDDGYAASMDGNGEITIGAGLMYLGGLRLRLPQPVPLDKQPEWIDQPSAAARKRTGGSSVLALLVSEQEVQAIEDQALREVALGGPDTAARTRLMQHIVTVPTKDTTCAGALKGWNRTLKPLGLALQPDTCALDFNAALQVSFYPPAAPVDPCCPPAQGGYLGSDNQLIRVTVTSYDTASRTGTLLWGWNNASFLYRARPVDATADPLILTLSPAPVDAAHTPQLNQTVEILRSTMILGDPTDQNCIAAPEGIVIPLTGAGTAFDPSSNLLTLPSGTVLPSDYATDPNPLFLRLWQAQVPFTDGVAVQLDLISGLAVTVHIDALPAGPLEAHPFWDFAVRPNTPQQVYPQSYLQTPQGPAGPRRWLTNLALIDFTPGSPPALLADCRIHFPTKTAEDCGCCDLSLSPAQVTARGGLQAILDVLARTGQTLSLHPGTYTLTAPLALTRAHAGLSLSACQPGRARITADAAHLASFPSGLITLANTSNITLSGLAFDLPLAPATIPGLSTANPTGGQRAIAEIAIAIRLADSESITIADCQFAYPSPPANADRLTDYIGAGIYAAETCTGLRVLRNRFLCASGGQTTAAGTRHLIGLWVTQNVLPMQTATTIEGRPGIAASVNLAPATGRLDDVELTGNFFSGMSLAVLAMTQLGLVRCTFNRVTNSCGGFWFIDSDLGANAAFGQAALATEQQASDLTATTLRQVMQPVFLASALHADGAIPSTPASSASAASLTLSEETRTVLAADHTTQGTAAYTSFMQTAAPAAQPQAEQLSEPRPGDAANSTASPDLTVAFAAYATLASLGIARELAGTVLTPNLSLRDNDIELLALNPTLDIPASLQGIRCMLSLKTAFTGSLFVSGNRVQVPNGNSIAFSSEWAANTVITGNLFNQLGVQFKAAQPCAVLLNRERAITAITGNLVNADWLLSPARSNIPATSDWKFLNTVL